MFWGLGKSLGPQGGPQGPPRGSPKGPERVSEEPNEIWHVGYQFSQFSALKMNTGSTYFKILNQTPMGWPMGVPGLRAPLGGLQRT